MPLLWGRSTGLPGKLSGFQGELRLWWLVWQGINLRDGSRSLR